MTGGELGFPEYVAEFIRKQAQANRDAVDLMCERALQQGLDCGVLVTTNNDGTVTVEIDTDVPFGEIHWMMGERTER